MILRNFQPILSAKMTTTASSQSINFGVEPIGIGDFIMPTYMITNYGAKGAYVAFGNGSATAVASTTTPTPNCVYIAAGAVVLLNAPCKHLVFAAIWETSATTLEISIGEGN